MPRRSVDARKEILQSLRMKSNQSWSDLLRSTGLSKTTLSRHLNALLTSSVIKLDVNTIRRPPISLYSINSFDESTLSSILRLQDDVVGKASFKEFFEILNADTFQNIFKELTHEIVMKPVPYMIEKENVREHTTNTDALRVSIPNYLLISPSETFDEDIIDIKLLYNPFFLEFLFSLYRFEKEFMDAYNKKVELKDLDVDLENIPLLSFHPILKEYNFVKKFNRIVDIWYDEIRAEYVGIEIISTLSMVYWMMYIQMIKNHED